MSENLATVMANIKDAKARRTLQDRLYREDLATVDAFSDSDDPDVFDKYLLTFDRQMDPEDRIRIERSQTEGKIIDPNAALEIEPGNGDVIKMPDSSLQQLVRERYHSEIFDELLIQKWALDRMIVKAEHDVLQTISSSKSSMEQVLEDLNLDKVFRRAIDEANSGLFELRSRYPYLGFGKRGMFSLIESVSKLNKDKSFTYNRTLMPYPDGSLTPVQILDLSGQGKGKSKYTSSIVDPLGGISNNLKAEIAAAFAMAGHYEGQLSDDCLYVGVNLFDDTDAMHIAAYLVSNISARKVADYSTVAAIGKAAIKALSHQPLHLEMVRSSSEVTYYLLDHMLVRLLDAKVLTTNYDPKCEKAPSALEFSIHKQYLKKVDRSK